MVPTGDLLSQWALVEASVPLEELFRGGDLAYPSLSLRDEGMNLCGWRAPIEPGQFCISTDGHASPPKQTGDYW